MKEQFNEDIKTHKMRIFHDDGIYRHLNFKGDSGSHFFDIITWPGSLTIHGDMGTYVFSRIEDMFSFFCGNDIDLSYWAEKCVSESVYGDGVEVYSEEKFRKYVNDYVEEYLESYDWDDEKKNNLREAVRVEVLCHHDNEYGAYRDIVDFSHGHFNFHDFWESSLKEYTPYFIWCLHAIVYAIKEYDNAKIHAN